jgi:dienelactone hydrolase
MPPWRSTSAALAAVALCAAGCGGGGHPTLSAVAGSPFVDSPVRVDARGLEPHQRVTLGARWRSGAGATWASSTRVRADGGGAIDLHGITGARVLWAMRPPAGSSPDPVAPPPLRGPSHVSLSLAAGGAVVAHAQLARRLVPGSVRERRLTVAHDGVSGELFTPVGRARRPAVLAFGGSEGGNTTNYLAGALAAHGYTTLSIAYFNAPGVPQHLVNIPLEYFARALRILRHQPTVDPGRVVIAGVSRGGEASLLIASTFPHLVHGAIGLVPSAQVNPGFGGPRGAAAWTYRGKPIRRRPIAVERIDGPILTAGGGDDLIWNSTGFTQAIEQRLVDHHFCFPHHAYDYTAAGHAVGGAVPYLPHPQPLAEFGGTLRGDEAARADLWPRILDYLAGLRR